MKKALTYIICFCFVTAFVAQGDVPFKVAPKFPGGNDGLRNFVKSKLSDYSNYVRETSFGGRVDVGFLITENGSIDSAFVVNSCGVPALDSIALTIPGKMPLWTPGKINDQNVRVNMRLPIVFHADVPVFWFNIALKDSCYMTTRNLILKGNYKDALTCIQSCKEQGNETYYLAGVLLYKLREKKKAKRCFEKVMLVQENSYYYRNSKQYLEKLF